MPELAHLALQPLQILNIRPLLPEAHLLVFNPFLLDALPPLGKDRKSVV